MYHLPPGPQDADWKKMMNRRIMGAIVSPREVYQLMPWSWLIDYFVDLGQFVDAVSPGVADRLAADYCYIMETETYTGTVQGSGTVRTSSDGQTEVVRSSNFRRTNSKVRHEGSPFGWGVNPNNLSLSQQAILGALGLSRL